MADAWSGTMSAAFDTPRVCLKYCRIRTELLPPSSTSIGTVEKLFGERIMASEMASPVSTMLVPAMDWAAPSSTTVVPPTNPSTWLLSLSVSDLLVPDWSRSSAVTRVSLRPHTPPVALTKLTYAFTAFTPVWPNPGIGPEMVDTFPSLISSAVTPTSASPPPPHDEPLAAAARERSVAAAAPPSDAPDDWSGLGA